MKDFERLFLTVMGDYLEDYTTDDLIEELFPGMSVEELFLEMYNQGVIPEDTMEKFLGE